MAGVPSDVEHPLRVLVSSRPYRGHVHPLIPLARAFLRRGHSVAVATGDDVAAIVAAAGLAWLPAGMNPRQVDEIHPRSDPDYGYPAVRAKVDDLLEIAVSEFRPDVIVRDPTDLAAIIAAEIVGAVNVIYGLSRFIPKSSWEILGADRTMTRLRRDYRLRDDPDLACMYSDLYLAVLPPFLESSSPLPVPAVQQVRYVPWDGDHRTLQPRVERDRGGRPLLLMTLGTVYNTASDLFLRFLDAVDGEDLDVICTLGDGADPTVGESAPPNVRFERYLPHSRVLPCCDALLCHGGFNTVMGSLVAGVPLVCVPLGSDQEYNARLCARRGFGVWLEEETATPERIREAVRRVVGDGTFSEKVRAFQQTMAKRPALLAAVARVERLVAERRPRASAVGNVET